MSHLKYPRIRHSCVTDGHTYVYIIGGDYFKKVERYNVITREVVVLNNDAPLQKGEGINMAVCFQNTGAKCGIIYVLTKGKLFALPTNGASLNEKWFNLEFNFKHKEKITNYHK